MNTHQERPRKGGGNECQFCNCGFGRPSVTGRMHHLVTCPIEDGWRKLLPVSFTASNAQLVHDGKKWQTRRLPGKPVSGPPCVTDRECHWRDGSSTWHRPRWNVGDILWVQEPWRTDTEHDCLKPSELPPHARIFHEGNQRAEMGDVGKLRHGRFLPLRFARPARYEVTAVKCEQLQSVHELDAIAEGCMGGTDGVPNVPLTRRSAFIILWNLIHTKPGARWEQNPFIFVYTFNRIL